MACCTNSLHRRTLTPAWSCALLQLPMQLPVRQHGTCFVARLACSGHMCLCKVNRSKMRCLTLAGDPGMGREAMKAARYSLTLLYRISYDELYNYHQDFGGGLLLPLSAAIGNWLGTPKAA